MLVDSILHDDDENARSFEVRLRVAGRPRQLTLALNERILLSGPLAQ